MTRPVVVWFRQDMRLGDNPALAAAADGPVILLFVLDDETPGRWRMGGASRWWLHHSLAALGAEIAARGGKLILRRGRAETIVPAVAAEAGARAVHWNRCYEPFAIARDTALKAALKARGIGAESFNATLLFEPWTIRNKSGEPFRVFSPFWRACLAAPPPSPPVPAPARLHAGPALASDRLDDWGLLPRTPDWAGGLRAAWTPGEAGATVRAAAFLSGALTGYADARDRPAGETTSRLSPHLHWGEISPRTLWHALDAARASGKGPGRSAEKFLSELGWREFSHHLIVTVPDLAERNLRREFDAFPWADDPAGLRAWTRGQTGYPIVDAGMRELWRDGWMHNRVRMIAASFLVKDLLVPWQQGADWFWDTLVDADLANNAASWQWVAGCGADAAPYFRIFNPILQGERFDPQGTYVRTHVPELARLPDRWIHRPFEAPPDVLAAAGLRLGRDYPTPIIAHDEARTRALRAFEAIKARAA